jgi:hypothetical protein
VNWDNPDFEDLTMKNPGNLVARSTLIRPGGNHVLSFLDVLAPDAVSASELIEAFRDLSATMPLAARHWRGRSERVSVRFVAEPSNQPPMREFVELSNQVLRVFQDRPPVEPQPLPIVIRCSTTADKTTFTVDESSRRRLLAEGAPRWLPGAMMLDHATRADLADAHPDYLRDVALVLTGLDEDALARIGGVRLVDAHGGEWLRWPTQRSEGEA